MNEQHDAITSIVIGCAFDVVVNDGPGCIQHVLSGAVVLFQQDLFTLRIIFFKADHIAVIDSARIAEYGTHAELLVVGGRYAALAHAWEKSQVSN